MYVNIRGIISVFAKKKSMRLFYELSDSHSLIFYLFTVTVVNAAVSALTDNRSQPISVATSSMLARPTILRKRDLEG